MLFAWEFVEYIVVVFFAVVTLFVVVNIMIVVWKMKCFLSVNGVLGMM